MHRTDKRVRRKQLYPRTEGGGTAAGLSKGDIELADIHVNRLKNIQNKMASADIGAVLVTNVNYMYLSVLPVLQRSFS